MRVQHDVERLQLDRLAGMHFVRAHDLKGSGVGSVDAHLLCAARLAGWTVWTADGKLRTAARRVAVAFDR